MLNIYTDILNDDGTTKILPTVTISKSPSDKYELYSITTLSSRLDVLAEKYYSDPTMGKVILMANPKYSNEWDIPDGEVLRIPFPKSRVVKELKDKINLTKNVL